MPSRPNIVLIFADQMRFDCLGVVNDKIQTPNLDRLAQRGALMRRAYAPTPVCLPCRAAILSGQYCSTNRAAHNHCSLPEDHEPTLGGYFHEAGYSTTYIGKSHFANCHDPVSKEGFPHIANYEYFRRWHGPWYGFEQADLAIGHTVENHARGMHYGAWLEDRGVDIGTYFGNHEYTDYGPWHLPEEHHNNAWVVERATAAIDRARAQERPFFIWANLQDPHNPCLVPEPWASMYDPKAIPDFGFKPGEPECFAQKPPFYQEVLDQPGQYAARCERSGLQGAGNVSHLPYTKEQVQENAACYYGMVSMMDKWIGKLLDHLEATGEAENTLIVFTADHGDLLGDHGLWWKSLVCYDESIRVPFIASWPKAIPMGVESEALVNLVDLFPTFCEAAGLRAPWTCEGVNQLPSLRDPAVKTRRSCIVEERPEGGDFCERILVDDDGWKLAFYAGQPWGELYDTAADPHCTNNLYEDPAHRDRREAMIRQVLSHEMLKGKPRPSPTAEMRSIFKDAEPTA